MQSVLEQTFPDYEYIIIDGGSMDASNEVIKNHEKKLVYWISERDNGIYHAMNKGIQQAAGEYVLFLNSGDSLYDDKVLKDIFSEERQEQIIYGNVEWTTDGNKENQLFPGLLTFEYLSNNFLPHQATFIHRSLFELTGLYDEQYTIVADWAMLLLARFKHNASYVHLERYISICNKDGISCRPESWPVIVAERKAFIDRYFPSFKKDIENLAQLRKELAEVKNELKLARLTFGYRVQKKVKKILPK